MFLSCHIIHFPRQASNEGMVASENQFPETTIIVRTQTQRFDEHK